LFLGHRCDVTADRIDIEDDVVESIGGRLEGKATILLDCPLDASSRRWLGHDVDAPPKKLAQARLDAVEASKIGKSVRTVG